MPADIKSKQLFLVGEFYVLAPRSNNALPRRCRVSFFVEQRNLADGPIAQRGRGAGKRFVDAGKKFRTVAPNKIKRAGFDQTFQHFAISDTRPNSSTKIFQRRVFSCLRALLDRYLHRGFAHVFDRGQPVADHIQCGSGLGAAILLVGL